MATVITTTTTLKGEPFTLRTRERENKHKLPLAAAKATQRLNDRKLRTLKTARMRVREQQGETERERVRQAGTKPVLPTLGVIRKLNWPSKIARNSQKA